jgi:hypothetical protein
MTLQGGYATLEGQKISAFFIFRVGRINKCKQLNGFFFLGFRLGIFILFTKFFGKCKNTQK